MRIRVFLMIGTCASYQLRLWYDSFWGSGFGVVGAEEEHGAVGGEGEGVVEDFVEGGLPPEGGVEVVQGPAEALGGDADGGVEDEDGHLLSGMIKWKGNAYYADSDFSIYVNQKFDKNNKMYIKLMLL